MNEDEIESRHIVNNENVNEQRVRKASMDEGSDDHDGKRDGDGGLAEEETETKWKKR